MLFGHEPTQTQVHQAWHPKIEQPDPFLTSTDVDKINLVNSFKTWLSCTKCNKQITDLTSTNTNLMKCPICSIVQPASSCSLNTSIRIAVRDDPNHKLIRTKSLHPSAENDDAVVIG